MRRPDVAVWLWALALPVLLATVMVSVVLVSIIRPLRELHGRLVDITDGEGDLAARLDETGRDEITTIAGTLNGLVGQLAKLIRSTGEQATAVVTATEELSVTSASIAAAKQAAAQAQMVSATAEHVSSSVKSAATGSEQMGAAIREISESANNAARVAGRGAGKVGRCGAALGDTR